MITSSANPQLKLMRSLGRRNIRRAERAFLVEGRRLVEEAVLHGGPVRRLLVREDVPRAWLDALPLDARKVRRVATRVFDAASDVSHAQGVAAICDLPETRVGPETIGAGAEMSLILDRLRDPGNVGTALRSAAASGVRTVLVSQGTADPFSPRAVRSGMGAHFRLRIGELSGELIEAMRRSGAAVVYAEAGAPVVYTAWPWRTACALVVGGETEPLSPAVAATVTASVAIPMAAEMESLNAGVAASVLLFEARRQRGTGGEIV